MLHSALARPGWWAGFLAFLERSRDPEPRFQLILRRFDAVGPFRKDAKLFIHMACFGCRLQDLFNRLHARD